MKINGSLVFDANGASELQNLRVQKYATIGAVPAYGSNDSGRLVFVTGSGVLYYGSPSTGGWVALATGGNAATLQTEVDAIETTLGTMVNSDGTTNVANALTSTAFGSATDLTTALNNLATYAIGHDTLAELLDVNVTGVTANQYLKYDSGTSKWVPDTLTLADVTDVTVPVAQLNLLNGLTATAAELNVLDGISGTTVADLNSIAGYAAQNVSAAEFGYLDGVTSGIQGQLDGKQPLDTTLTGLAGLSGTGIVVETAADTFANRTMVAPAAGFTITNPAGIAGNPTFELANDLAALEGLTTTGYVVRTGDGTATTRSLSVNPGELVITGAADGVSTDTTFGLATVTNSGAGSFLKLTRDGFGRVTGTTPVVLADIKTIADGEYVNAAGDSMTGNLVMGAGTFITLNETAVNGTDAVNKAYVDAATQGLSWKQAVVAASTANLTLSGEQTVDGVALVAGNRVLVKDQTTASQNGIYVVATGAWTRAADMNDAAEFDGSAVFVQQGTVNEGTGWTETQTVATVGTSAVAFSQFSGGQAFVWGTGLANTGNTVFVNLGAGIKELPTDEIGLDVVANLALQLTGSATGDQLTLVLASGSGLEQSAAGLKISAAGVTNAMLANPSFTINGDTGTDTLVLGDTFQVKGTSVQGISTTVTEAPAGTSIFTITAADASSSQKGVAKFQAGTFAVTSGNVDIATAGVSNAMLANSSITVTGTTGSDAVSLGESFAIVGGSSPITTASAGNTVTISIADASGTAKGLASFEPAYFSVDAGAVSLAATLDDLLNVTGADTAAEGDLLTAVFLDAVVDWQPISRAALLGTQSIADLGDVTTTSPAAAQVLSYNGTAWVNKKIYHVETVSAASTSWTVTHGLGVQYCNVTVVDDTDNVVIPQSIVFNSTTGLTVTFNTAIAGKVVVMGIA